jgi:rod shape determining protein RodA
MRSNQPKWKILLRRIDWPLVIIVAALAGIGILNLSSASQASGAFSLHLTQTIWFLLGTAVVTVMCVFDYRVFERWTYLLYGGILLLLVAVLLVGTELNGSQRWLNLGFFLMQPSELLKIGVVLVAARYFHDREQSDPYRLRELILPFSLVGAGIFLVVQQPDLGTSVVILAIFMTCVVFEGLHRSSVAALTLAVLVAVPVAWNVGMHDYQRQRVKAFLNLTEDKYGASWQVRQSVIAFGSGRVWGKGHGEGTQIQKGFVPEHENDFIASNWGEEHGFAGMVLLLGLYGALIGRALTISRRARDTFGAHIGVGVAGLIFWHVLVNIGMVTGLVPVVGLTLPLLSYGGSSLLTTFIALGLLMNVSMRARPLH